MEFKVIETQEQFDSAIADRLKRAEEKYAEKYSDYDDIKAQLAEKSKGLDDLNNQIKELGEKQKTFDETIAAKDLEIKKFTTNEIKSKVAGEMGLSIKSVEFLKGETEEEIKASANALKSITTPTVAPLKNTEPEKLDTKREALKSLAAELVPKN